MILDFRLNEFSVCDLGFQVLHKYLLLNWREIISLFSVKIPSSFYVCAVGILGWLHLSGLLYQSQSPVVLFHIVPTHTSNMQVLSWSYNSKTDDHGLYVVKHGPNHNEC